MCGINSSGSTLIYPLDANNLTQYFSVMTKLDHILAVEQRAFAVRKTVSQVCDLAGVYPQTWSRAKSRGAVSVDTLLRMERVLDKLEKEQAE